MGDGVHGFLAGSYQFFVLPDCPFQFPDKFQRLVPVLPDAGGITAYDRVGKDEQQDKHPREASGL